MTAQELLLEYHEKLMAVRRTMLAVPNEQRGGKNAAAANAGGDFSMIVGEYDERIRSLCSQTSC